MVLGKAVGPQGPGFQMVSDRVRVMRAAERRSWSADASILGSREDRQDTARAPITVPPGVVTGTAAHTVPIAYSSRSRDSGGGVSSRRSSSFSSVTVFGV